MIAGPDARAGSCLNAMTVDVEDYFHVSVFDGVIPRQRWDSFESRVAANTERLLAIFDDAGIRATFFILGWVAERFPGLVQRIAGAGHEIASHGYAHRLVYDQTPVSFREDLRRGKGTLEQAIGSRVLGFRAPSYSITPRSLWAFDALIEEGFVYDASIFPIRHDRYGIPDSPRHAFVLRRRSGSILECPASTVRVGPINLPIAGGGYFRILPYAWTRWGIRRLNQEDGRAAVFYLHPWEIDPLQPRLPARRLGRFRHYRNLDKTEVRLRSLLRDFRFGPLQVVLNLSESTVESSAPAPTLPYQW
jgi:polysaccharide deacetylase family protein (PEP-CTERM system associated)